MMSRKNYIAVAAALKETHASEQTIKAIADVFQKDNPRFDRERFFVASSSGLIRIPRGQFP